RSRSATFKCTWPIRTLLPIGLLLFIGWLRKRCSQVSFSDVKRRSPRPRLSSVAASPLNLSNLIKRLSQVFTQIIQIFHSDREPHKCIVDAKCGTLLGWDRSMSHECRMFNEALYSAKTFCECKKLRM